MYVFVIFSILYVLKVCFLWWFCRSFPFLCKGSSWVDPVWLMVVKSIYLLCKDKKCSVTSITSLILRGIHLKSITFHLAVLPSYRWFFIIFLPCLFFCFSNPFDASLNYKFFWFTDFIVFFSVCVTEFVLIQYPVACRLHWCRCLGLNAVNGCAQILASPQWCQTDLSGDNCWPQTTWSVHDAQAQWAPCCMSQPLT